jgi:hypothetical protein
MIDFPASPTLGQQFTAAGVTWTWDGTKWTAQGLSVAYLPLTGGTLSGNLTVAPATGIGSISIAPVASTASLVLNRSANNFNSFLDFQSAGSPRWRLYLPTNEAETGGNAGSNFNLSSFGDNNAALPTNLIINRASGAAIFGGNITAPGISAPQAIGDNRIINGDMRIDQRNNGASGTAVNTYTVDRWSFNASQTAKGAWQRFGVAAPSFPYAWRFTSSSAYASLASDNFVLIQPIEADMISDFAWGTANAQPVTLSFWAFSSLSGVFGGSIRNQPSPSTRSYPFSYTLVASTWTKVVITIPGDTAGTWVMSGNAGGVAVQFDLGSGSTFLGPANAWASANYLGATGEVSVVAVNAAQFFVTGVKLEIGSVATPYNRQSLTKSMADCQRYYQLLTGQQVLASGYSSAAGGILYATMPYMTAMRVSPSVAYGNVVYSNASALGVNAASPTALTNQITVTATGGAYAVGIVGLTAEL